MQKISKYLLVIVCFCAIVFYFSPTFIFAAELDNISGNSNTSSSSSSEDINVQSDDSSSVSNYLHNYNAVTDENMAKASEYGGPITTIIGNLIGLGVIVVPSLIFLITIADLVFIGFPPLRSVLYKPAGQQGGSPRQWVSDEALACLQLAGGGQQQQQQGGMMGNSFGGGYGGGGFGGGGFGGGGFGGNSFGGGGFGGGGMMGQQGQQQQQSKKSIIIEYFKKRTIFVIAFIVCLVVLTSSVLTDSGINIAEAGIKMLQKFNGAI